MIKGRNLYYLRAAGRAAALLPLFWALFFRCANISGTMEGGPRDSLPPRVVKMTPPYNTTGIRPQRVTIEFDEMIQLKDMTGEFFTSPFMETMPVVSYKNKKAIVTIDSPMDTATTYVLNLGSGVVDNNEGNPAHGLKYTFSTGSHIDSMYMSGFVSDALTADTVKGAYIFFYRAEAGGMPGPDSLLFDTRRAAAVARTMSDGGFIFPNLKAAHYRVYALLDRNSNRMYDPGTDGVAFLPEALDPGGMPSFRMWYDSVRQHMAAQPQVFLRTFTESPRRAQNLVLADRQDARRILLQFAAPHPLIEHFTLEGIPPDRILAEHLRPTGDSTCYWIDMPAAELPDTIRGVIRYERPDSTGQPYMHRQELSLVWQNAQRPAAAEEQPGAEEQADRPTSRREIRRAARVAEKARADSLAAAGEPAQAVDSTAMSADSLAAAADTLPLSKMQFTFSGNDPVIPGQDPELSFELPLNRLDADSIRLLQLDADSVQTPVAFELVRDSLLIRRYRIRSEWADGRSYRLDIPAGALQTIDGERNDPISQDFQAAKQQEMASVALTLANPPADYRYIVQVTDPKGTQTLRELAHLSAGTHQIGYLAKGKIRLRMIEDRNGNGRWDTGDLVRGVQPEMIAWYQATDSLSIDLQGPVELEPVDVSVIFRPRTFEDRMPEPPQPEAESAEPQPATLPEEHEHDHGDGDGHEHEHDHEHGHQGHEPTP